MLKAVTAVFLFALALGTARAVPVPLNCSPDGSVCSSGVAPLGLTGMIDPDNDFLIHWWLRFEGMQHLEPPAQDQPWSLLFDFSGSTEVNMNPPNTPDFYDFESTYLTDMDEQIPETDLALTEVGEIRR